MNKQNALGFIQQALNDYAAGMPPSVRVAFAEKAETALRALIEAPEAQEVTDGSAP